MVPGRAFIPHVPAGVVALDVTLAREAVVSFLDYPPGHAPPARIATLLDELLPEARGLVQARGAVAELDPERAGDLGLPRLDADGLVLGLVTIGGALEARASELASASQATRALLLDAAGSAAAEEAADRLSALLVAGPAEPSGGPPEPASAVPCRLSPGFGRWPLERQRELFACVPHQELGVRLSPACLMVPRKSISFALWLGAREPIGFGLRGCAHCTLERCRHRGGPPTLGALPPPSPHRGDRP